MFIAVEQNTIVGIYSGKKPEDGQDYRDVPSWFAGCQGQDVREFDARWELLPLEKRLALGLIPDGQRYKVSNDELVPKSLEELVRDGLEVAPAGLKLDPEAPPDAPRFTAMSIEERLAAGQISKETAALLLTLTARRERDALLAGCDWTQASDQSAATQELWRPYRQALRDVPAQGGFPWSIEWPMRPDGLKV